MSLSHRERVATALARETPDRCPMQISFTPEFADRLRADMGVRGELNVARGGEHNPHGGGNTYELERAIGSDLIPGSIELLLKTGAAGITDPLIGEAPITLSDISSIITKPDFYNEDYNVLRVFHSFTFYVTRNCASILNFNFYLYLPL